MPRAAERRRGAAVAFAALLACLAAVAIGATGVTERIEGDAIDHAFTHRAASTPGDVAVIAIDTRSLDALPWRWPFPRTAHARLVDRLHAAGVRQIVFDVEFAQPTPGRPQEDLALFDALGRAGGGVLAATETDDQGRTQVLGGDENLRSIHAQAAAAAIDVDRGGVARRLPLQDGGLPTMAVTVARRLGIGVPPGAFTPQGAWIDFAGPPGTVPTYSYADVYRGRVPRAALAGRVVVVGATSPLLHDLHSAPTSEGVLMSGAELQANAIHTALAAFPLRSPGSWLVVLTAMLLAASAALLVLVLRPLRAACGALVVAMAYVVAAQTLFGHGWILPVVVPLIALGLSIWWSLTAVLVIERAERRRVTAANAALEHAVRERTAELHRAHLEIVRRLAYAVESRDGETGAHVDRMSALCELLALAAGLGTQYAELLRHASVLHDIGKLSVPDAILLKRGALDDDEREEMQRHALAGAAILRDSPSRLLQVGELVARTHHERWDGSGYPAGLRGEEIPIEGRIAAICDVFDALVSERPYKRSWSVDEAITEVVAQRGRHFDPALVDAFAAMAPELRAMYALSEPQCPPGTVVSAGSRAGETAARS